MKGQRGTKEEGTRKKEKDRTEGKKYYSSYQLEWTVQ